MPEMRQTSRRHNGSGAGVYGTSAAASERQGSGYLHGLLTAEKVALSQI
jgi:hypothetical protein